MTKVASPVNTLARGNVVLSNEHAELALRVPKWEWTKVTYSYESFLKELGVKLRTMRIDRGWTLRDMIVDHGYHLAQWQTFEKGRGIAVPSLLRLCEVFDVTIEELIGGLGARGPAEGGDEKPVRVPTKKASGRSPTPQAAKKSSRKGAKRS